MVYLLKDLRLNKYLFKINKKKSILNQNFFIKELKYFYKIKNKKLLLEERIKFQSDRGSLENIS